MILQRTIIRDGIRHTYARLFFFNSRVSLVIQSSQRSSLWPTVFIRAIFFSRRKKYLLLLWFVSLKNGHIAVSFRTWLLRTTDCFRFSKAWMTVPPLNDQPAFSSLHWINFLFQDSTTIKSKSKFRCPGSIEMIKNFRKCH